MPLTNAQQTALHEVVLNNIFYKAVYNPSVFVPIYLQLDLAKDDAAFQYVFSYLDPLQLSKTYDWIVEQCIMEDVFSKSENVDKLFFGIFDSIKRSHQYTAAEFEEWVSTFTRKNHPSASSFAQADHKRKEMLATEAARKMELEREREYAAQQKKALVIQQYANDLKLIETASHLNDYLTEYNYVCNAQELITALPEFQQKIKRLIKTPMDFRKLFSTLTPSVRQQVFHLFEYSFLISLAIKQHESSNPFLYCIDANAWIEAMKPLVHAPAADSASNGSPILVSAVPQGYPDSPFEPKDFYPYANAHRFHLFTVEYEGKKGDQAKTAILNKLAEGISTCGSKESLAAFKAETMSEQSEEFKLLKTGTGFFTRLFGLKTDSEVALEKMFIQAESLYPKA